MRWWINRPVFGVGYVLLGALGVVILSYRPESPDEESDRYITLFAGLLLVHGAVVGLALVLFVPLFARLRAGPAVGTAPSGEPATCFRRSPFLTVCSIAAQLGLVGWLGAIAVVACRVGQVGWAVPFAGCALALLWPSVAVARGTVAVGGLWLTPSGIEYRREAVGWTLAWSDLRGVQDLSDQGAVLPFQVRRGQTAAVRPVLLVLDHGVQVPLRRTLPRLWNRECGAPFGTVCVDCFDLAGGPARIAEAIEHYRLFPERRIELGA